MGVNTFVIANARGFLSEIICKPKIDIIACPDGPTTLMRQSNFENLSKTRDECKDILYKICVKKK